MKVFPAIGIVNPISSTPSRSSTHELTTSPYPTINLYLNTNMNATISRVKAKIAEWKHKLDVALGIAFVMMMLYGPPIFQEGRDLDRELEQGEGGEGGAGEGGV